MAKKTATKETEEKKGIQSEIIKVRLTLTEGLLGTSPADTEIHSTYIASLAPDALSKAEEVAAVGAAEVEEKSITVFPRDEDGSPFLWDYQIKGFFKGACGFLRNVKGTYSKDLTSYKKKIDGLVFVYPRRVRLHMNGPMGQCQRPLRASTAQGERVALAHSEESPAGSFIEFDVECLTPEMRDCVYEWLDYGEKHGIGQWRNSGKGRFTWDERETESE